MDLRAISAIIFLILLLCNLILQVQMKLCPGARTCFCHESKYLTSIFCKPVSTMAPITQMLSDYFRDKPVAILQLSMCNVRNLEDKVFSSSKIQTIKAYCPLQTIDNSTFVSVKNLWKLSFVGSTFEKIPEALQNLTSLELLSFTNHAIGTIDGELRKLLALKTLVLRNGKLSHVSKDAFVHSYNLTSIYLPYNMLTSLDTTTFDSLPNLRNVDLCGNHLHALEGLFSKLNPQVIDLYSNNITDISGLLHDGMWKVQTLRLGQNSIKDINPSTFTKNIPNVELLDLSHNKLSRPDVDLFQTMTRLTTIYLNYNGMQELPQGVFNSLNRLKLINLEFNFLPSTPEIFVDLPALETLNLSFNKFTSLSGIFRNLTQLETLSLAKNEIMSVFETDFDPMPNLEALDLSINNIHILNTNVFNSLSNLKSLNLSHNTFISLNFSLQPLQALEILHASHCRLRMIGKSDFANLTHLRRIVLSYNNITTVNGAFQNMPVLEAVSINGNNLTTLTRETFANDPKIKELYLRNNPWVCDCRLLWLIEWLYESEFSVLRDNPYCSSPPTLQGIALKELTPSNLTEWTDGCPRPCTCSCSSNDDNFSVSVNCSHVGLESIPDSLPQPLGRLDVSSNDLKNISLSINGLNGTGLTTLDLSNNLVEDINMSWPESLRELMLSNNKIRRFPLDSLGVIGMQKLTLGENPWICDCETIDFKKWLLQNKAMVTDLNNVRCGYSKTRPSLDGQLIITLSDQQLCSNALPVNDRDLTFYLSLAGGVIGVILILYATSYAYRQCGFAAKAWMYSRGCHFVKKQDHHDDKEFDILLLYTSVDSHMARNVIIPALRTENPLITICDPQNTHGGTDPIAATRTSRRIIVILSPEYLEDRASMAILHVACNASREERIDRLIVIKYGILPCDKNLSPPIKKLLRKREYLVWGENLFWEKFYFSLPEKSTDFTSAQNQQDDDEPLINTS